MAPLGRLGALAALLAACAAQPDAGTPRALLLKPDGFEVGRSGLEIGFGRAERGAVAAVSGLLDMSPVGLPDRCGVGRAAYRWPEVGLTMVFENGAFRGWSADATGRTRLGGFGMPGIGAPAVAVPAGLRAETGADGQIVRMSAGVTCPTA